MSVESEKDEQLASGPPSGRRSAWHRQRLVCPDARQHAARRRERRVGEIFAREHARRPPCSRGGRGSAGRFAFSVRPGPGRGGSTSRTPVASTSRCARSERPSTEMRKSSSTLSTTRTSASIRSAVGLAVEIGRGARDDVARRPSS